MGLVITPGFSLRARLRVPGDKSISHRALMLAGLGEGVSVIRGLSTGADVKATAAAMRLLGAEVEIDFDPDAGGRGRVSGGRGRLRAPEHEAIDVGNSGTTIRLLTGLCATLEQPTILCGDASIARRPMDRVAVPLRAMGAIVTGDGERVLPPLFVRGDSLHGIDYDMPVASAQVKSAILLAGLAAEGETVVRESQATRAHTEEMLAECGASITVGTEPSGDGGAEQQVVRLSASDIPAREWVVPGDPSQAAYWLVGACIVPGSEVVVDDVYLGPARAGFVDVLTRMGADIERVGERSVRAAYSPDLHGTEVGGAEVPGLIDEIPILAVAAAVAAGPTTFSDIAELRVKESDRVATMASELRRMGAEVDTTDDGMVVHGNARLTGTEVTSHGDHRVAMSLAIAAIAAVGTTDIQEWGAVRTSYPEFEADLDRSVSVTPCS